MEDRGPRVGRQCHGVTWAEGLGLGDRKLDLELPPTLDKSPHLPEPPFAHIKCRQMHPEYNRLDIHMKPLESDSLLLGT